MKNNTLSYYDKYARIYAEDTKNASMKEVYEHFLKHIPKYGNILDYGCGSGRDAKYFHESGYVVDAIDGSEELCKTAREYSGLPVKHMLFQDLSEQDRYDGIWACASILHLPRTELAGVFYKMLCALKETGVIYTSFKYGMAEEERNGRYFMDFTEQTFQEFMADITGVELSECWISKDVRPGREDERWLNMILRKSNII